MENPKASMALDEFEEDYRPEDPDVSFCEIDARLDQIENEPTASLDDELHECRISTLNDLLPDTTDFAPCGEDAPFDPDTLY